jgi:prevent-host-death family protein
MRDVTVAEAKNRFSDLLRRAEHGGERLVVHRHGKPVAAIVSTDDLRRLEALEDAEDLADARAALAEAEREGTIPFESVLEKYGLQHLLVREAPSRPRKSPSARRRSR